MNEDKTSPDHDFGLACVVDAVFRREIPLEVAGGEEERRKARRERRTS